MCLGPLKRQESVKLSHPDISNALLHKGSGSKPGHFYFPTFYLQNSAYCEWAMLGSNQRPLPCEGRFAYAAAYRQEPQNRINKRFLRICAVNIYRKAPPLTVSIAALLLPFCRPATLKRLEVDALRRSPKRH
jgi:hypothetical protein